MRANLVSCRIRHFTPVRLSACIPPTWQLVLAVRSKYTAQYGAVGPDFAKSAGRFGPKATQTRSPYHVASSRACSVANIPSIFGALRAAMRLLNVFLCEDPCGDRSYKDFYALDITKR
jgi:hypothetical protein